MRHLSRYRHSYYYSNPWNYNPDSWESDVRKLLQKITGVGWRVGQGPPVEWRTLYLSNRPEWSPLWLVANALHTTPDELLAKIRPGQRKHRDVDELDVLFGFIKEHLAKNGIIRGKDVAGLAEGLGLTSLSGSDTDAAKERSYLLKQLLRDGYATQVMGRFRGSSHYLPTEKLILEQAPKLKPIASPHVSLPPPPVELPNSLYLTDDGIVEGDDEDDDSANISESFLGPSVTEEFLHHPETGQPGPPKEWSGEHPQLPTSAEPAPKKIKRSKKKEADEILHKCENSAALPFDQIAFATRADGSRPAQQEWEKLKPNAKKYFTTLFTRMCEHGRIDDGKKFKKLTKDIWEFKSNTHKLRITCFMHQRTIYLCNIFTKKEDIMPTPKELNLAKKIRLEHISKRNPINPLRRWSGARCARHRHVPRDFRHGNTNLRYY